jgi:hypothetical protein
MPKIKHRQKKFSADRLSPMVVPNAGLTRTTSIVPNIPNPNAGLSFLQAALGFVLGVVVVVAVIGCFQFRCVALDATARAAAAQFEVSELRAKVENLAAWENTFGESLEQLQKAVSIQEAVEMKAHASLQN